MNISYKWLKEYVDFDLTAQEVCDALTSTGLEVDALEEVQSIKGGLKGLYVGKVLTCEAHPNSDHLHVTTVDLGKGEPSQIVQRMRLVSVTITQVLSCCPMMLWWELLPQSIIIWRATGSSRWISRLTVLTA